MIFRAFVIIILALNLNSCSGKDKKVIYESQNLISAFDLYEEGMIAFEKNDFFFASKKFSEAELGFSDVNYAAKAAIMSAYSLYGINFYSEALENLERYLKIYPSDKNIIYAHFLTAIIFFEQIDDEKKDIDPVIKAYEKINFFLEKYPNTDYAIDLKFKKDLIENQLAAKEMFVAKYYISIKKWVPAINRLKIIVKKYNNTIFIEEALHRLVEIHYHIGLENEAKEYASILGYNYNSGEWFKQTYKILNKEYKISKKNVSSKNKTDEDKSFFKKIIKMIK